MTFKANLPVASINKYDAATGTCAEVFGDNYVSYQRDLESDCCAGGMMLADLPRNVGILIAWIFMLSWIFLGVAIGADTFMTSIEVITSKEKKITKKDANGDTKVFHTRVWNATVANLTLMALGSSAPEILLSVIEVLKEGFNSGALGPSTIVGSAAFNLMVITAVCIVCLPAGEVRVIKQQAVFLTTSAYSIWAYIWLLIMVVIWTPEVITVTEGVLTIVFMVTLLVQAYVADKYWDAFTQKYTSVGVKGLSKKDAAEAIKAAHLGKDATPEELADALKDLAPPKSRAHYRHEAMKGKAHKNKVTPEVEVAAEGAKSKVGNVDADSPGVSADPESAGIIKWKSSSVDVMESGGHVTLTVQRVGGSKGEVTVDYATKNQKAVAGKDYEAKSGTLTFKDGDSAEQSFDITIYDDDEFEKDEEFTVVLSEIKGGAKFEKHTDGGEDTDVCTVMIVNDDDRATKLTQAISLLKLDADSLDIAGDDWMGQIKDCFSVDGEGPKAVIMHVLTFPWKLMFAIFPPAGLFSGWPCFFTALLGIGFQVILINDFASQMGCQMYIKPSITAITFVALGTSLPDTFASMQAAIGDKYADNSIGNVTGSNSVNVLLGLGLPWLIGAVYWSANGADASWHARFHPVTGKFPLPQATYDLYSTSGAFVVSKGDLGFSVIVFTVCAVLTIGLILVRRKFGQELGGNKAGGLASAGFLVFLWFLYIILSSLSTYGFITLPI
jgi:Ca2+/Na+ antiporter